MERQCPACGLYVPSKISKCECGYDFETGQYSVAPPNKNPLKKIRCPEGYMELERPEGDGQCSDNECPCGILGTIIRRGEGYIYISQQVVDIRRDCPTNEQVTKKLERLAKTMGIGTMLAQAGVFTPIVMCEQGAKKRGIDLEVAGEDARYWWETGLVPLRVTPKAR